ncbi:NAD(P)/FAD-dependent oxidoreductase [Nonomuraea sp. K274]|uniref:NAD(P)/FAD-dependent oxidoreductase n=1 Tax=Nonomuraea cypriaca TaxID=1187855 RepID=A0A931AIA3_9ACTN|nr:NAD(P)/FAD-dependent oxidoreductase [Nonomuraea cypriaca]MBF8189632.1 NAD(P)/FAD-dependent oxidoreductase [Nonomuraea cypriaca]
MRVELWHLAAGHDEVLFTEDGARRLRACAGIVDVLPDVPALRECWGRDVAHCPYCHGWEIREKRIGALATGAMSMHQALLFRQRTDRLTLLLHTEPSPSTEQAEGLAARGILTNRALNVPGRANAGAIAAAAGAINTDLIAQETAEAVSTFRSKWHSHRGWAASSSPR